MTALRRLAPLTLLALAVAAAIVLLDRRPPWPQLPAALGLPVTTTFVQRVLLTAAWVALLVLLAIVAVRAARAARPRPRGLAPTPARRPTRSTSPSRRFPQSMPLRVARPPEPTATSIGSLSLKLDVAIPATATDAIGAGRPNGSEPAAEEPSPAEPAAPIRLRLLGPFEIEGAPMPRRASTRELIAFLAFNPNGATRDQLLEALWPGADPRRSRPRLWQSTAEARRVLGDAFLRDDDGRYRLDRSRVWIDTDELAHQPEDASATDHPGVFDGALALWRGEPLDGTDYAWADAHVRQLRGTQIDLLVRAGTARLTAGDAHTALQAAERGIAIDQLHEPCWRLALKAEAALGLRDAVTRRYEQLTKLMDERLGLRPASETVSLYRRLLGS